MLLGVTVCASSLTLEARCPQRCSSARTCLVICTVVVTVLRWGLPLAIVMFRPGMSICPCPLNAAAPVQRSLRGSPGHLLPGRRLPRGGIGSPGTSCPRGRR